MKTLRCTAIVSPLGLAAVRISTSARQILSSPPPRCLGAKRRGAAWGLFYLILFNFTFNFHIGTTPAGDGRAGAGRWCTRRSALRWLLNIRLPKWQMYLENSALGSVENRKSKRRTEYHSNSTELRAKEVAKTTLKPKCQNVAVIFF